MPESPWRKARVAQIAFTFPETKRSAAMAFIFSRCPVASGVLACAA